MAENMQIEYEVSVTGLGEAAIAAENASRSAEQASYALTGARSSASSTLPIMLMSVRGINAARLAVEQTTRAIEKMDLRAAMYGFLNMMQVVRNLTSLMNMLKQSTGAASAAQAILAALTGRWWLIPLAIAAGAIIYAKIKSMQEGGVVPETGLYRLHKGEEVVPRYIMERRETVVQVPFQLKGKIEPIEPMGRSPKAQEVIKPVLVTPEIPEIIKPMEPMRRSPEVREIVKPVLMTPEIPVATTQVRETTHIYNTRETVAHHRHVHSYGPIFITFEKQPREGIDMDRWLRDLGPMVAQQARRGG